jgi:cytidine deaminase
MSDDKILHSTVQQDEITKSLYEAFEYDFVGVSEFTVPIITFSEIEKMYAGMYI